MQIDDSLRPILTTILVFLLVGLAIFVGQFMETDRKAAIIAGAFLAVIFVLVCAGCTRPFRFEKTEGEAARLEVARLDAEAREIKVENVK